VSRSASAAASKYSIGEGLDAAGCLTEFCQLDGQVPAVLAGGVRDDSGGQVPGFVRVFFELAP
jgi:hypothetical protein